jgi:CobQ-like glutamine amidotransferase family enzyme
MVAQKEKRQGISKIKRGEGMNRGRGEAEDGTGTSSYGTYLRGGALAENPRLTLAE